MELSIRDYARAAAWIAGTDGWMQTMWRNPTQQVGTAEHGEDEKAIVPPTSIAGILRRRSERRSRTRVSVELFEVMIGGHYRINFRPLLYVRIVRLIINSHDARFLQNVSTRAAGVEVFTRPGFPDVQTRRKHRPLRRPGACRAAGVSLAAQLLT